MNRRSAMAMLAGAAIPAAPLLAQAQTPAAAPIRIAGSTTDPYMVPYYASDLGTFAKAGLNVDLTTQPTVAGVVQAVAANAADVGQGDLIQLANAVSRGLPLAVFAGGALYRTVQPQTALGVLRDSRYRSAQDLQGTTIGVVTLQSLGAVSVQMWLRINNVDPATVKLVEIPFPQMVAAMEKGETSASLFGNAYLQLPEVRTLADTYRSIGPTFYVACWFGRRDWLAQNRAAVKRLVPVIYDTAKWANGHTSDTAPMLSKYAKLELDTVKSMVRTTYATALQPQWVTPVLNAAYLYKAITTPVSAQDLIFEQ
jgi:NitT/TauT family transport system substrate-binding protein